MDPAEIKADMDEAYSKFLAKEAEIADLVRHREVLQRSYEFERDKSHGWKWTSIWLRRLNENQGRQNMARQASLAAQTQHKALAEMLK